MKTNFLLLLMLFFVFSFQNVFSQEKYSRVFIETNDNNIKILQQKGLPLDEAFFSKTGITIELSQNEIKELEFDGFKTTILIDDVKSYYASRNSQKYTLVKTEKTPENFHLGESFGGNLTLSEVMTELDLMATLYPNLISVKQEITTEQTTYDGNYIYWVKISDNPAEDEEEPEVLYTALTHAREPVSMMHLIYYMWYLLENYETDAEVQNLVENFEQYFVPVVNPDGYYYNEQTNPAGGGMFRKNRKNNGDGTYGVDLNRNFPFMWGYDNSGSSGYTYDETYRGVSAGSEPETQMVMEFASSHNFLIGNNNHTYSNIFIYPYGYDESAVNPEVELFKEYASIMTRQNHFATGRAWELLYTVNGESNDWMYNTLGTYTFCAETGDSYDGFWPEQNRILSLCEGNLQMNLYQTRLAGMYAEARDASSSYIQRCGYFNFNMTFLGLDTLGTFKVYIVGQDVLSSDTIYFSDYQKLEVRADSIFYVINDNIEYGDVVTFDIYVDNGKYAYKTTVQKTLHKTMIAIDDPANNLINWTTTGWNTTTESYHSSPASITDSPNGDYSNDDNSTITTTNVIDLTQFASASLSFWAKWDIETDWDYAQILISTNGGTSWTAVATEGTNNGTGSFQPNGEPVFDGGNTSWSNQTVDLSSYISNNVKFRFQIVSDGSVTKDGFYFDDFQIISAVDDIAPIIVGQNNIQATNGVENTVEFSELIVTDEDDEYPTGFQIIFGEGDNYTLNANKTAFIPAEDYQGILNVQVKVCDGYKFSDFYTLNVNVTNSISETKSDCQVFPNPASDFINVSTSNIIEFINIYNVEGKILINSNISNINISNLEKGIYIIEVISNDEVMRTKFVKK